MSRTAESRNSSVISSVSSSGCITNRSWLLISSDPPTATLGDARDLSPPMHQPKRRKRRDRGAAPYRTLSPRKSIATTSRMVSCWADVDRGPLGCTMPAFRSLTTASGHRPSFRNCPRPHRGREIKFDGRGRPSGTRISSPDDRLTGLRHFDILPSLSLAASDRDRRCFSIDLT
jgi:hypothetical protein